MAEIIEIGVPIEEIAQREARVKATRAFQAPDRVPVWPAINTRFWLPKIDVPHRLYFGDPEIMLRSQILGYKWIFEHVDTDQFAFLGSWGCGWTDFQNASESGSLGCEVVFPADDLPWVSGKGWLREERDLRRLEKIDIIDSGINARQVAYRHAMRAVAEEYPVRFKGGPVFYPGENAALTLQSCGPFTIAADLMGEVELLTAIRDKPELVSELLDILAGKILTWLDYCWKEMGIPNRDYGMADDLASSVSPQSFWEVILPSLQRIRRAFSWFSFHMCGKADHLLQILVDELQINEFNGFGYQTSLESVARIMGGRVVLQGNVNPMRIAFGSTGEVEAETKLVIDRLGKYRGLILMDGANIPPEAPLANINAMMVAAKMYGAYP
jgi:uroporphyrinogen decarboxylase